MSLLSKPAILEFPYLGDLHIGLTATYERASSIPFVVNRVFWIYDIPETISRGNHAHHVTEQVIVAIHGSIQVTVELKDGVIETFYLNDPRQGLYIPASAWHTMRYSSSAVQLVLASHVYDEADYIRSYSEYKKIWL